MNGLATVWEREDMPRSAQSTQWSEIVPTLDLSSWQREALKKLYKIAALPQDWDSYGSLPPLQKVVSISEKFLLDVGGTDFNNLPVPSIVPVSGGGIQLEWSVGSKELEIEVLPDGTIEFLKVEEDQPFEEGEVRPPTSDKIHRLLDWLM